jgi:hypothetical protein
MLTRRFFFLPLALLLVACGKPAESPPPAASAPETWPVVAVDSAPEGACPWAITVDDEGAAQVEPDPGMGAGQVVWQGALNDDGAEDLLLRFPEGCGNYGECPYALYVACPGEPAGRYREVREPDYAMDVQMGTQGDDGWRSVLWMQREGDRMREEPLAYSDGGYRATTPSN